VARLEIALVANCTAPNRSSRSHRNFINVLLSQAQFSLTTVPTLTDKNAFSSVLSI
jgi:hypothetical protein